MTLWRVDVAGVSHRFVQADTRDEALASVSAALLAALDLRAASADASVSRLYEGRGLLVRKRLLAALDGLTSKQGEREARLARRRLARQVRHDLELGRWVTNQVALAPRPVDLKICPDSGQSH